LTFVFLIAVINMRPIANPKSKIEKAVRLINPDGFLPSTNQINFQVSVKSASRNIGSRINPHFTISKAIGRFLCCGFEFFDKVSLIIKFRVPAAGESEF
jgi:hypothetical protein